MALLWACPLAIMVCRDKQKHGVTKMLKNITYIVRTHGLKAAIVRDVVLIQIPLDGGGFIYKPVKSLGEAYEVLGYE